jgi:hypothetical protein
MNIKQFSVYTVIIATVFSGFTSAISQSVPPVKIPPIPTNVPNIRTFVAPPVTFNPIIASEEQLQQYGFPPMPNRVASPTAYSAWVKAVSAPQTRLESPQLVQTPIFNGPAKIQSYTETKELTGEFNANASNSISSTSFNWSGYVTYDNVTRPFAKSYIYAYWIVPVAQHAFGQGLPAGWDYSSQWVGIDGWGSPDVLQAGTEADAYLLGSTKSTFYAAWIEWYPFNESRISNFSVAPGNELFVEVWNTSPTVGNAYLVNFTTQQSVAFTFNAPGGTTLVGNSAEWIMERPGISGGLAPLTNYVACPFDACYAFGSVSGGTYNKLYYPGMNSAGTTVYAVSMLDNGGGVISVPGLIGSGDLWFRDTGSAYKK